MDESLARFQSGELLVFLRSFLDLTDVPCALIVDYIDLFLIHDPFSGTERRLATYKALQEAKQAGKIRSVGVSN